MNLSEFLKNLIYKIDNNKLTEKQIQNIGKFYMEYEFKNTLNSEQDIDEKNLIKYLSLGWFMYNIVKIDDKL
jgi:hypothetical protein